MLAYYWIFCKVIDNFGDAAVAWRLSSLLQQEQNIQLTLFIDDLQVLAQLNPQINPNLNQQSVNNINIINWQTSSIQSFLSTKQHLDCVIELFACDLPPTVINFMEEHPCKWLNLEYLSAEEWTKSMHLLPSPQKNNCQKNFYFLGFDQASGGLLREKDYALHYTNFHNDIKQQLDFFNKYPIIRPKHNEITILLFAYPSDIWLKEIQALIASNKDILIWLANPLIEENLKQSGLLTKNNAYYQAKSLRIQQLPFIPQHHFDCLLWLSDIAIIRGEESFTRAQFAATPFFWHIYPQEETIHLSKLNAFWQLVYPDYQQNIKTAHHQISQEINNGIELEPEERISAWKTLFEHLPLWEKHSQIWSKYLIKQTSATDRLVSFIEKN